MFIPQTRGYGMKWIKVGLLIGLGIVLFELFWPVLLFFVPLILLSEYLARNTAEWHMRWMLHHARGNRPWTRAMRSR
jgi:hypothetical protein